MSIHIYGHFNSMETQVLVFPGFGSHQTFPILVSGKESTWINISNAVLVFIEIAMKTMIYTFCLLLCFPLSGMEASLLIGTNEFQVVFADTTLEEQSRTKILMDLQSEYTALANGGVSIQNTTDGGYIRFRNVDNYPYENDVNLPCAFVRGQNGTNCTILVEQKLSDKYRGQFLLENTHTNVFQSARDFVQDLGNGVLLSMTTNQVSQFFYYEHASAETLAGARDKLSHWLDNMDVRQPGVLSIFLSSEAVPSLGEVFVMGIPYTDRTNGNRHDAIPAVWIDGRWKLLMWD